MSNLAQNSVLRKKIKLLIADDSSVMRLLIKDLLESEGYFEIVGMANNGKEAVDKTQSLKPDVVVLDMIMGEYDGLYAVKNIMKFTPTPIIILSSMGNNDMSPILEALEIGAVDYVNKPQKSSLEVRNVKQELVKKILVAADVNLGLYTEDSKTVNLHPHTFEEEQRYEVVAIGASTGGPSAIEKVLSKLPVNMNIPIIIIQHMPQRFIKSFTERLSSLTPLEVVVGKKGMELKQGQVIISPGDQNMIIRKRSDKKVIIDFTDETYKEYNYPSVNSLMVSAAKVFKEKTIGVILTGMGKDGTIGMQAIKQTGGYTIAQDKRSSVVFGMPGHAIEAGIVDKVAPINDVGACIVGCLS